MTTAPRVASLHTYPIKSCRGVDLVEAPVEPRGVRLDRRFLVVDDDGHFRTQRKDPRLALVEVRVDDGRLVVSADGAGEVRIEQAAAERGPLRDVNVWRHRGSYPDQGNEAATFFSDLLGSPSRLVYMPESATRRPNPKFGGRRGDRVGFADAYPVLLTTTASLRALQEEMGELVPMDRFRANVVLEHDEPWTEDAWRRLRIGEADFDVARACTRCVITTTDQRTGERGCEPMATLARTRRVGSGVAFGVYLIPRSVGAVVRVGDEVHVQA